MISNYVLPDLMGFWWVLGLSIHLASIIPQKTCPNSTPKKNTHTHTPLELFLLTPSITVPLFKVFVIIRCVTRNRWVLGVGSGMLTFLALDTRLMLRKNMRWCVGVGNDVNLPWIFLHVWYYARLWAGVWRMMPTFLELAYMFDATQDYGLGCGEWC